MKSCSNKAIGSSFEQKFCRWLGTRGYWVHFIAPDAHGAQPFDIIAARNGDVLVADCKTSARPIFSILRLEENQKLAFEKWIACGNPMPYVAVLYDNKLYMLHYQHLKSSGRIDLRREDSCKDWEET